mmetsp:Transcript_8527/g.16674  ORF Transcript_8527/g.16674 Transcript_8527/m.16674 type:complete len:116 (-) Transcript_8527:263-610(-)
MDQILDAGVPLLVTGYCLDGLKGYDAHTVSFILCDLLGGRCLHPLIENPFRSIHEGADRPGLWANAFFFAVEGREDSETAKASERTKEEYVSMRRRVLARALRAEAQFEGPQNPH